MYKYQFHKSYLIINFIIMMNNMLLGDWMLTYVKDCTVTGEPKLTMDPDCKFHMKFTNQISGKYEMKGNDSIKFMNMVSTKMMSPQQEKCTMKYMESCDNIKMEGKEMTMCTGGDCTLKFMKCS